jgi:phosphodiesterase/alkaline phosphatase D-like protein
MRGRNRALRDVRGVRARFLLASCLASIVALVALSSSSASAATGHAWIKTLSQAPPGTPLVFPEGLLVNGAGNVFVAEGEQEFGTGRVHVFNAAGKFEREFNGLKGEVPQMALDSSGRLYVADSGSNRLMVFKPNGTGGYDLLAEWTGSNTPAKAFEEVAGVAVDNSTSKGDPAAGDVFKPEPEGPEEAKEGKFLSTLKGAKPALEEPGNVAVNSATGQVYVANAAKFVIEVFSSAGVFEKKIIGKGTPTKSFSTITSVAVEEATGDVYVADGEGKAVDQFNAAGEWIGWITVPEGHQFGEPRALAIAPSGRVYVSDREKEVVYVFGPNLAVPSVTTTKAAKVVRTGATLTGTINPEGKPSTTYHFEYGTTQAYGSTTAATEVTGALPVKAASPVTGLKPQTTYDYRIVGENANGKSYGANSEFETPAAVTGVSTLPAKNIKPESATLTGSLFPEGLETEYHFAYGETTLYGKVSPTPDAKTSATAEVAAETTVSSLRPNTTYHFRLIAKNNFGSSEGVDRSFTTSGPPRIFSAPSEPKTHTSETVNAKINPDELATTYFVEYGETTAYGKKTEPEGTIAAGEAPFPISAELKGLKLATTYHFRVVAKNEAGEVRGPDQEFTTALIESESAKSVSSTEAILDAQINPLGIETKYRFEYGETTSYGTSVPAPDGSVGKEKEPTLVKAVLPGLRPETTYHYRVVATVEGEGSGNGPDRTFTTLAGAPVFQLPDGRAYEMITPTNKHGGYVEPIAKEGATIQASEDGNALAFEVRGPIVEDLEGNRSPEEQQVLSIRNPTFWDPKEIVSPHDRAWGVHIGIPPEYQLFSRDLALGLVQPFPRGATSLAEPPLASPQSETERGHQEKTIYLRGNPPLAPSESEKGIYDTAKANAEALAKEHGGEARAGYVPLVTAANVPPGTKFGGAPLEGGNVHGVTQQLYFAGATPDLTHVVLESLVPLAVQQPAAASLYEWTATGSLQLVSVLPSGAPANEPRLGFARKSRTGSNAANHAISTDGRRVIWTDVNLVLSNGLGHLYLRDMAHLPSAETIQLDVPEKGLPDPGAGEAQFQIASADGSRVFFTDTQKLTKTSTAKEGSPDLYECQVVEVGGKLTCKLADLSVDPNAGESANVQGLVLGASEDGSYVYIVATGALAQGAEVGNDNLYVLHLQGETWTTKFVARLSPEDTPDWFVAETPQTLLANQTTRVSSTGRFLAFMSNRRLTGYNNTDVNEVEVNKKKIHADEEVFLYDAASKALTCVSCNPSGARPRGVLDVPEAGEGIGLLVDRPETWSENGVKGPDHWLAGSIPGWTTVKPNAALYQSRYLSDSGRMFFTSADPLVPAVSAKTRNETIVGTEYSVGVENVYEFEPNGTGGCTLTSGCIALISKGTSEHESAFLDASANGNDVFFLTLAQLSPQDLDQAYDIYDARVCEASPCQSAPPPTEPCGSIETCREASPPLPVFGASATSTFSGPPSTVQPGSGETLNEKHKKPPPLTNSQKLAKALKACRKLPHKSQAQRHKRAACEAQARKKYGKKAGKKAKHSSSRQAGGGR